MSLSAQASFRRNTGENGAAAVADLWSVAVVGFPALAFAAVDPDAALDALVLSRTRDEVRELSRTLDGPRLDAAVRRQLKLGFYNTSEFDFAKLLHEPDHLRSNLIDYVNRFSARPAPTP